MILAVLLLVTVAAAYRFRALHAEQREKASQRVGFEQGWDAAMDFAVREASRFPLRLAYRVANALKGV